ncbi:hypothetical protein DXG01_004903 [Tephrocybe rancida]|nr:hypothetical protein DXG01_004903 [Tephrocybe rancida]
MFLLSETCPDKSHSGYAYSWIIGKLALNKSRVYGVASFLRFEQDVIQLRSPQGILESEQIRAMWLQNIMHVNNVGQDPSPASGGTRLVPSVLESFLKHSQDVFGSSSTMCPAPSVADEGTVVAWLILAQFGEKQPSISLPRYGYGRPAPCVNDIGQLGNTSLY